MDGMRAVTVKPAIPQPATSSRDGYRSLPFGQVETSHSESVVLTLGVTLREGASQVYGETELVLPSEAIAAEVSG